MEPYPSTGTYDDLWALLAREELKRSRHMLPHKSGLSRLLLEPALNLAARGLVAAANWAPEAYIAALEDRFYRAFLGREGARFDEESPALREAAELGARIQRAAGREPALLCLLSHPPATGELMYLNVELLRHALWAMRRLRGRPCRPRMVIAVDRFALDMLPVHRESLYAGFMGLYHMGIDRLVHTRAWASRGLLEPTSWRWAAWRIARQLYSGGELGMVLSGGVPTTGRLLYGAREYLGRLRASRDASLAPSDVISRLERLEPDFARFHRSDAVGPRLRANAWRAMEAWVLAALIQAGALEQADRGDISPAGRAALRACAQALACEPERARREFQGFEEEFSRQTPYRERFFRFLAARVAARGRPILLLALTHGDESQTRVTFGRPEALLGARRVEKDWMVRVLGQSESELPASQWSREFVRAHYA